MHTVETTFKISFTDEQFVHAQAYIEDMKKHMDRVFWIGKEEQKDDELILSHIAHKVLSGFYNAYSGYGSAAILEMVNSKINGKN